MLTIVVWCWKFEHVREDTVRVSRVDRTNTHIPHSPPPNHLLLARHHTNYHVLRTNKTTNQEHIHRWFRRFILDTKRCRSTHVDQTTSVGGEGGASGNVINLAIIYLFSKSPYACHRPRTKPRTSSSSNPNCLSRLFSGKPIITFRVAMYVIGIRTEMVGPQQGFYVIYCKPILFIGQFSYV